jgi:hypothetical protein
MTKSLAEFKRFLVKSAPNLSEHEKKLANLILGGFHDIAAVGSAGGRRGKVLAKLIVDKGEAAPPALEIAVDEANANQSEIVRLTKLEVEHFRGFSDKHTFEFKNQYTFVYGPNGTGKSSLCEALEYGLLASIHEADSKRIPVSDYIRNATSRKSAKPVLYGDAAKEKGIEVKADPRSFEFSSSKRTGSTDSREWRPIPRPPSRRGWRRCSAWKTSTHSQRSSTIASTLTWPS